MKGKPGSFLGKKHSTETKQKISEKLSINNKGGRAKWYDVAGQMVQGTWERDLASKFEQLNIRWLKLKTNKHTLKYEMNDRVRSYTPDFYLPDYEVFVEVKGFWWGNDKEKMKTVLNSHPDKTIMIVEKEEFQEIMLL
jgi:predicted nuclease of restriction endonuclease-like RecB superfamily